MVTIPFSDVGDKRSYAISGAVLIHPVFAIAGAEDIAKINPLMIECV